MLEFKVSAWSTYGHCYLSFAGRGWEEVLLSAGVPEDTRQKSINGDCVFSLHAQTHTSAPGSSCLKPHEDYFLKGPIL